MSAESHKWRRVLPLAAAAIVALASFTSAGSPEPSAQRAAMVARLRDRGIKNDRVLAAMGKVPRDQFVPETYRARAYDDGEIPIGQGQVMAGPYLTALMAQVLDPRSGATVLEIGTGCGYQAAVVSEIARRVYTVESFPILARTAAARLAALGYSSVKVRVGDGARGWEDHAPFDAILVTCAVERVPEPLIQQLKDGGCLVVPIGLGPEQTLNRMRKTGGRLRAEAVIPVRVPRTLAECRTPQSR